MTGRSPGADDRCREVIEKYAKTVRTLAYARTHSEQDADDIFGEVFLRYARRNPRFDSEEHEKAWFIRVTINCSNSLIASAYRRRTEPLSEDIPAFDSESQSLDEYLLRLTPEWRTVIHLFYYEDMPVAEIAQLLSLSESAVRMRLTRARRALRELLEGDDFYE